MAGPLLLLDTATLYYRSFFALPESMTAPDGFPHNAVRGVLTTIGRLRDQWQPRGIVAAWDTDWRPQWRVDLIPSYKTHRLLEESTGEEAEPDTLGPQISALRELLGAGGVPVVGAPAFEADDIIATLAAREDDVVVVSGDRDLIQVVRDGVSLLSLANGGMDKWPLLTPPVVREKFGVEPGHYVDLAVLRGDPSDGLPGVKGIGEKTAAALLQTWGTIEEVYQAADESTPPKPLTPRIAQSLRDARDYVRAAKVVATARTDVPISDWQEYEMAQFDPQQLAAIAREWGVEKFIHPALRDS